MHLRLIEIENFRGIKKLFLKLDVITAAFGEGSFGKSSLVEALHACLSPFDKIIPEFKPEDFHLPPGQDEPQATQLSITLTFREGTPYEWSSDEYADLASVINEWRDGRREIAMKIEAKNVDSKIETKCVFLKPNKTPIFNAEIEKSVNALRRLCPVIALRWHETVSNNNVDNVNGTDGDRYILSVYRKAISQPDRLTKEELAAAIDALSKLEGRYPASEAGRIAKYQVLIDEIRETTTRFTPLVEKRSRLSRFGDLHQVVALLAIVGTLLETRGTIELAQSTEPIIAVENLETNLHPIALASLWDLLAQIPVQKLIISNSDDLLASVPLKSLRRVVRRREGLDVFAVRSDTLTTDDIRRIGYHLRLNRADAIMNRCWLFVEGESEGWLLPEMAHILGYDFKSEGIRCVEFAQCGIEPMIKLADDLGIEWHLLSDGDQAGQHYVSVARQHLRGYPFDTRISCMKELDIEHHLCKHGFLDVYARAAGQGIRRNDSPHAIVKAAVKRNSKPSLILKVIEYAQEQGMSTISPLLTHVVETCVRMARKSEPEFLVLSHAAIASTENYDSDNPRRRK